MGEHDTWTPRQPPAHGRPLGRQAAGLAHAFRACEPGGLARLPTGACRPRAGVLLGALIATLLVAATPDRAQAAPKIIERPSITGDFTVGGSMTATARSTGGSPTWTWLRCAGERLGDCSPIAGEQAPTYRAVTQDEGSRLRVRLTVPRGRWSRREEGGSGVGTDATDRRRPAAARRASWHRAHLRAGALSCTGAGAGLACGAAACRAAGRSSYRG